MNVLGLIFSLIVFIFFPSREVLIESVESKTTDSQNVYNQIKLVSNSDKDTWLMKQSYNSSHPNLGEWDQLKIIVDKKVMPYQVSFHQIKNNKEVEYKISCYLCHSNGPRAIRPNFESTKAPLGVQDRLTVMLYNFKIKTYGPVKTVSSGIRKIPLGFDSEIDNEPLKVKTCLLCHNNESKFGRGVLRRQHSETIKHLVNNGQMPPWPYQLSETEKKELNRFVAGF